MRNVAIVSARFTASSACLNLGVIGVAPTASKVVEKIPQLAVAALPRQHREHHRRQCPIGIDAMGCQTEIAQKIVDAGADFLLSVKENQKTLCNRPMP